MSASKEDGDEATAFLHNYDNMPKVPGLNRTLVNKHLDDIKVDNVMSLQEGGDNDLLQRDLRGLLTLDFMKENVDPMIHAFKCDSTSCEFTGCKEMKELIKHMTFCVAKNNDCAKPLCPQFKILLFHVVCCKVPECSSCSLIAKYKKTQNKKNKDAKEGESLSMRKELKNLVLEQRNRQMIHAESCTRDNCSWTRCRMMYSAMMHAIGCLNSPVGCKVPFCKLNNAAITYHRKCCKRTCSRCCDNKTVYLSAQIVPMWYLKSDLPDVQSHLIRLLHAHKTRNVECKSTGEGPICIDTYCKETKELLEHAALCENTMDCMVPRCTATKVIMFHTYYCKIELCSTCKTICDTDTILTLDPLSDHQSWKQLATMMVYENRFRQLRHVRSCMEKEIRAGGKPQKCNYSLVCEKYKTIVTHLPKCDKGKEKCGMPVCRNTKRMITIHSVDCTDRKCFPCLLLRQSNKLTKDPPTPSDLPDILEPAHSQFLIMMHSYYCKNDPCPDQRDCKTARALVKHVSVCTSRQTCDFDGCINTQHSFDHVKICDRKFCTLCTPLIESGIAPTYKEFMTMVVDNKPLERLHHVKNCFNNSCDWPDCVLFQQFMFHFVICKGFCELEYCQTTKDALKQHKAECENKKDCKYCEMIKDFKQIRKDLG